MKTATYLGVKMNKNKENMNQDNEAKSRNTEDRRPDEPDHQIEIAQTSKAK